MMTFLMIIILFGNPNHAYQLQFSNERACEAAKVKVMNDIKNSQANRHDGAFPVLTCVEE